MHTGYRSSAGAPVLVYGQGTGPLYPTFRVPGLPLLFDCDVSRDFLTLLPTDSVVPDLWSGTVDCLTVV